MEYPENKLADELRRYADVAEAGGKPHWAGAMRLAAEQLEFPLREAMRQTGATNNDLYICHTCSGTGYVV